MTVDFSPNDFLNQGFELDWLKRWNLYSPKAVALYCGETGVQWTYGELFSKAQTLAAWLEKSKGCKPGDRILVLANNQLEYIALFFAAHRLGATLVPVNYRLAAPELDHILRDARPEICIFNSSYQKLLGDWQAQRIDFCEIREVLQGPALAFTDFDSAAETAALILYTSGTTGAPKGAVLSHRMLFWNSINTSMRLNLSQHDCAVIFLPLFHTGGWNVLTTPFLHRGAKIVLTQKFDADQVLRLSESERATILFGVPTTMDMLARSAFFSGVKLDSVRYAIVGGEPMPLPLIETWHKKGVPIRQGYGLTEFGPNVFSLNEEDAIRKIGSIGFPNFYIDAKIVDQAGQELGPDQVGELYLRGPNCMSGYLNNDEATDESMASGWLKTGDLVRRDHEGYYYVVGRKKDMFISGGENVYPAEVEKVLQQIPGVREAAVIGVKDPKWGEAGRAFIVKEPDAIDLDSEQVRKHCLAALAKFKVPRDLVFIEALPKGDSGKILKKELPR